MSHLKRVFKSKSAYIDLETNSYIHNNNNNNIFLYKNHQQECVDSAIRYTLYIQIYMYLSHTHVLYQ